MPFDPSKPFEVVRAEGDASGFDPSKPFEVVGQDGEPPAFDPSQPFEEVHDSFVDQVRGVGGAVVTGVKRALRDVDVLNRNQQGTGEPTASERRRALEMQAADPSWMRGRVDPATGQLDFTGGMSQFGYPAKLEQVTREGATERAATEFDIATQTAELNTRPRSEAMRAWDAIPDNDWWSVVKAVASDPIEVIGTITLESLPASLVGLPAGPAGVGAASFATEYAGSLVKMAQDKGYDMSKPEDVARFFANKEAVADANKLAQARGATVGLVDALTARLAGRWIGPAMGTGKAKVLGALAKETGMQMAGGATGEALGSVVAGQPVSFKDVFAEAIGELGGAPGEIVSNLREESAIRREKSSETPVATTQRVEPTGDEDLIVEPNRGEVSDNGLRTQKEETQVNDPPVAAGSEPVEPGESPDGEPEPAAGAVDWTEDLPTRGVVPVNEPHGDETMDQFVGRRSQMLKVKARGEALGLDVDVRWAPDLRTPDGRTVDGWVDPQTGRIVVNAASPAHASDATGLPVLREEAAHQLLGTPEGRTLVRQWAGVRLTPEDIAGLQRSGYTPQPGETPEAYIERLSDEMIAKAAREQLPWWRDLVERVKTWVASRSGGRIQLSNEEAARAVLRSLRRFAAKPEGGVPGMAPGLAPRFSLGLDVLRGKTPKPEGMDSTVFGIASWFQNNVPTRDVVQYRTATPEQNARVEGELADHVRYAYALHPESAGWYGDNVERMTRIMRLIDPTLAQPDREFVFRVLLAVTSDGNEVGAQFEDAWALYSEWRGTRNINPDLARGKQVNNIKANLGLVAELIHKLGPIGARDWLRQKEPLRDIRAAAIRDLGFTRKESGLIASSEMVDEVLPRSVVFGPKLGSLFNNLYGDFSTTTMDRWFMRTMGRITGTQVERGLEPEIRKHQKRVRDAVGALTQEDLARLKAAGVASSNFKGSAIRGTVDKMVAFFGKGESNRSSSQQWQEFRKAVNWLGKLYEPLVEAPENGGHRRWIRERMEGVRRKLESEGLVLNPADMQALLWYLEKEIYESLGYRSKSASADYASAAERLHGIVVGGPSGVSADRTGRVGEIGRSRGQPAGRGPPGAAAGVPSPGVRLSLGDPEPRRFGEQVMGAPDVSGEVKGRLRNLEYAPRANEPDAEVAGRIVDEVGVDEAMARFRDRRSQLPGAVRGMLAQVIVKRLASLEAAATPEEAAKLADKAARFLDQDVFEATTDAGQFIQSFAAFSALTPRGMLGVYRRAIDRVQEGARRRVAPVLQEAEREAAGIDKEAAGKLAADPVSQRNTRAAVDESVKASPDVQAAVRVVVAGEMANSPEVRGSVTQLVRQSFRRAAPPSSPSQSLWARYVSSAVSRITAKPGTGGGRVILAEFTREVANVLRSQVRAVMPAAAAGAAPEGPSAIQRLVTLLNNPEKAREVWSATVRALREAHPKDPRVEQLAAQPAALYNEALLSAVVREEMDAAGLSLQDMVAGHYRAAGDGQTLVQRIVAQTGLEGEEAVALARKLDDTWRSMVFRERERLDSRIRTVRESESRLARAVRSGIADQSMIPDSELDAAIRGQLRVARTNIGAILKQHLEARSRTVEDLARAFVQGARIPEAAARRLAGQLQERMRELLRARRRSMLGRVREALPAGQRGRVSVDKLLDLADLGLLTEEKAWNSIAEDLGLPAYSDAVARDITARANALRRIPEGFQRDEAAIDLLDHIANQKGMNVADLAMAMWYANTLSRPFTHLVNGISNLAQVGMHTAFAMARRPADVVQVLESLADGFKAGADEALAVLKTGKTPYVRSLKLEASAPLERLTGDALWQRALGKWKYVARALAASDMLFYKAAEDARRGVLARAVAKREGRRGPELEARVAEILGRTEGARAAARARASSEGLTGERARRRVRELLDASLPADVAQNARDHALDVIFNGEPYGLLGVVARGLGAILREAPALRLVVPFVRVVANVTNEGLNYVPPIGAGRALASQIWGAQLHGRDLDLTTEGGKADLFDQYAKAATGLFAIVALAALGADDDDPDRPFRLHGPGPSDPNRRTQLRQQGWIPWSIQVGDRFFSYAETPVGLALAVAGAYVDALRYKKLDQVGTLDRIAIAATSLPRVVVQRSFLRGVSDLMQSLTTDTSPRRAGDKATAAAVRAASGFVIPGAFEQLDRLMDPTITDTSTVQGALAAAVPFARRASRPVLNVLGEPVSISPMARFASKSSPDPLWTVMAEKRAWISKPDSEGLTDDEAYELTRVRGQILRPFLEARVELLRRLPDDRAQQLVQQASAAATRQARAQMGMRRPRR